MKIKVKPGSIKQFGTVAITVSDKMLANILAFATDTPLCRLISDIKRVKEHDGPFMCLRSGAKLCYSKYDKTFYIYGYHYAGHDILAAIEQLKMGYALYKADQNLEKMFALMGNLRRPTLKHKLDYDNMRSV